MNLENILAVLLSMNIKMLIVLVGLCLVYTWIREK